MDGVGLAEKDSFPPYESRELRLHGVPRSSQSEPWSSLCPGVGGVGYWPPLTPPPGRRDTQKEAGSLERTKGEGSA
jgi:hypothetical protein